MARLSDDERGYIVLRAIRMLAGILYPFESDSNIAPKKADALYEIVRLSDEAVKEHDKQRDVDVRERQIAEGRR